MLGMLRLTGGCRGARARPHTAPEQLQWDPQHHPATLSPGPAPGEKGTPAACPCRSPVPLGSAAGSGNLWCHCQGPLGPGSCGALISHLNASRGRCRLSSPAASGPLWPESWDLSPRQGSSGCTVHKYGIHLHKYNPGQVGQAGAEEIF